MQNSGTKLVLALVGMALVLGVTSWWYRYEAAHRASQFWGPEASRLIAESEGFEVQEWGPVEHNNGQILEAGVIGEKTDLSKARGQAHLRHAFLSDRNFLWSKPLDTAATNWKWHLRFHEGGRETWVMLSEDLESIGKSESGQVAEAAYSCEPMTKSLQQYFEALGLIEKPQSAGASNAAE